MSGLQTANVLSVWSVTPLEILVCGLSHWSAPIEVLEKLAFTPGARAEALVQLVGLDAAGHPAAEAIILSTCNRVELYAAVTEGQTAAERLAGFLTGFHGVPLPEAAPYLYIHRGEEAVRHLFAVAAGLDSLILGEPQILGQVRAAFEEAQAAGATGPLLSALFRQAIETGKRARGQTGISQGAASVSYAAVEVAAREFGDLAGRRALIIGAGKTGRLSAQCLLGSGVRDIRVANRTYERAVELAQGWGGQAYGLDQIENALADCDIVISCTNAPGYVLTREQVAQARVEPSPEHPLLLVDIAVPRDIDPAAATLPGVTLRNLEDLHRVVDGNLEQRRLEGLQAEAIVDEQVAEFTAWFRALAVVPVITGLREHAEAIRQRELARARNRLAGLSPDYVNIVEMLTQRIVNQLLHEPTVRLKEHASRMDGPFYAQAMCDLFALPEMAARPDQARSEAGGGSEL